jgi:CHAD domain-containing protein
MRTSETERELKYEVGPSAAVPTLVGVGGVRAQEDAVEQVLDATYYDTTDFRLARAGVILRRRAGGDDAGWHLKVPVGDHAREEIRSPLGRQGTGVPDKVRRLVVAYTLGEPLRPIARLRTDRFAHKLVDAAGETVATLTDDHVTGEAGGDTARLDQWREFEVELAPKRRPEVLGDFDNALTHAGATTSSAPSKLRRLIGDWVPEPPTPGKRPDAGQIVVSYLDEQLAALRRADVGVRLDTDDAVHQLRVTCRRLRAALRTFGSIVDKKATAGTVAELKWLGGELAQARDAEVAEHRLIGHLDDLPDSMVLGPVRQFATRHFARAERAGRTTALAALTSDRYVSMLRSLDELTTTPPLTDKAAARAKSGLRKPLRTAARKLCDAEAATRGLDGKDLDVAMHEVRKKAKRARYAADTVGSVYGGKLRKWRKNVKAAQSTLGSHQDTVVGRATLRRMAIEAHGENQNAFALGLLHQREADRADHCRQDFATAWTKLRKGKRPGWLS